MVAMMFLEAKTVSLPGFLVRPDSISIDEDCIYITDRDKVFIYNLQNFKLKAKFGEKGEGPGQFMLPPAINNVGLRLDVEGKNIVVSSMARVSFFDKKGKYLYEKKIDAGEMGLQYFKCFKNYYVGYTRKMSPANQPNYFYINLYDLNTLELKKGLLRIKHFSQPGKIDALEIALVLKNSTRRGPIYEIHNDLVIAQGNAGNIHIVNKEGKVINSINIHNQQNAEVSSEFKDNTIKFLKKRMLNYPKIANRFFFPQRYPVRYFHADNNKIYVLTFEQQGDKCLFLIYDIKGNFIKETCLPFTDYAFIRPYPYTIRNNHIYQLVENPDSDDWELKISPVKQP